MSKRYRKLVNAARRAERVEATSERITRAVATTFYKLLAVKDEYEVARLHADAAFRAALEAQFEGAAGKDFARQVQSRAAGVVEARRTAASRAR